MGRLLVAYARLILFVAVVWAVLIEGELIYVQFGGLGLLAAFLAWPFALIALPLYAGLAQGEWLPAFVTYGGWVAYEALYRGGRAMERWEMRRQREESAKARRHPASGPWAG